MTNWIEELHKRGIKTTPLPPPTPEQMERIQEANRGVVEFLKMMEEAYKASEKSTLQFGASKEENCSTDDFLKEEVLGNIDIQKLLPWQRKVYDAVNDYSKKLQAVRKRPLPHFIVCQHRQRRSFPLNAQKQR